MTTNFDVHSQLFAAIWETNAQSPPAERGGSFFSLNHKLELTDKEAEQLIRDVAELRPPRFVFAGADPLQRDGIYSLVQYAASCGLHPTMVLSPESDVSYAAIAMLKQSNLSRLELVLEAGTETGHDGICGMAGSFARTLQAIRWANECRLPVQIHTHIGRRNLEEIESIASLIKPFRIIGWSISFPVPHGGISLRDLPSAAEFEEAFARIHKVAQTVAFKIKTVEAPHYRRFVVQQRHRLKAANAGGEAVPFGENGIPGVLPVNEARASVFISSTGDVFPGDALRVSAGNVRRQKLVDIYRDSTLLDSLRDTANLKGKCGECEFKEMCGGSRARAWALTGDMFSEETSCLYQPLAARNSAEIGCFAFK